MEDPAEQEPWRMAMAGLNQGGSGRTGTLEDSQGGTRGTNQGDSGLTRSWRMARVGPEGQTRPALARQEARGEPAAWQAARVGPAGQEAWVAPAGRCAAASYNAAGGAAASSNAAGGAAASLASTGAGSVGSWTGKGSGTASWLTASSWTASTGGAAAPLTTSGGAAASSTATGGAPASVAWGTSQEPHKFPKRKVIQPPHPPPVEGLIEDTVEHVLQCRMVEPQPLCCVAEPLGKRPYVSTLLTEAAQGPELEDALVEGAG